MKMKKMVLLPTVALIVLLTVTPVMASATRTPLWRHLRVQGGGANQELLQLENAVDSGWDFLIITNDDLLTAANRLAARRNAQGLSTKVVSISDIPWGGMLLVPEDIKAYIQSAYDTWDPKPSYLLLLGDVDIIPTFYQTVHKAAGLGISPHYPSGFRTGTDLYYAILNGPEGTPPFYDEWWTPDLFYGRIPVDTLAQADLVIDKIIEYEDNQWNDPTDLPGTALVAAYFQDGTWAEPFGEIWPQDGYEDQPFVQTSEEIRDFLVGEGFDVERLYNTNSSANPTNYNNADWDAGIALPSDLLRPTYPWDADATDITNSINDGRFIVFHRDHGGSLNCVGSTVEGWSNPRYDATDVAGLSNNDHYTVVFSINCETGWFDGETDDEFTVSSECLCEAFLREIDGGAVGVFGATRMTDSGWNDDLVKGFVDAIWPNFDTAHGGNIPLLRMGEVLNYGKWYMSTMSTIHGWTDGGWKQVHYETYHYFGDPTMAFKIPTVIHDVAVTDVRPSPTTVIVGDPVSIEVDVLNEGTAGETFDVNVYYDTTLIGKVSVTLSAGASTTLTFVWDTTGVSPGTYTISAEVPPVPEEVDVDDNEFVDGTVTIAFPVDVDVKPGSWPNPLELKSKGVLPVAICGTADFDVTTIDPETVRLSLQVDGIGIPPLRWAYRDVATPYTGVPYSGHDLDGDGFLDLTLKFKVQEVIQTLGLTSFGDRDVVTLILSGNLKPEYGGLLFLGQDYVVILKR